MRTRLLATLAVAGLVAAGAVVVPATAHADPPAPTTHTVTSRDILPTQTPENYNTWHDGAAAGGRWASGPDGLVLRGKAQIIKGEHTLPTSLADYVASVDADVTGRVWYQIAVEFGTTGFTTLRKLVGSSGDVWTTSQVLGDVPRNGSAPLADLLATIEDAGALRTVAAGFYVDTNVTATVRTFSAQGVTTSFSVPAAAPTTTRYLLDTQIRPDETEYEGWHNGATPGGSWTSSEDGLRIDGKALILNGDAETGRDLISIARGLDLDADGSVYIQLPLFYGVDGDSYAGFTTLHATPAMAAANEWRTSRQVGTHAALSTDTLENWALDLGPLAVIGTGLFVDTGRTATIRSFTAVGTTWTFTPRPLVPGSGAGDGLVAQPAPIGTPTDVERSAPFIVLSPVSIFEPGETVGVWFVAVGGTSLQRTAASFSSRSADAAVFADVAPGPAPHAQLIANPDGSVSGEIDIPADLPAGEYQLLFQGAERFYWAPAAFAVPAVDDGEGGPKPTTSSSPKPTTSSSPKPTTSSSPKPGTSEQPEPGTSSSPTPGTSEQPKPGATDGPTKETVSEQPSAESPQGGLPATGGDGALAIGLLGAVVALIGAGVVFLARRRTV